MPRRSANAVRLAPAVSFAGDPQAAGWAGALARRDLRTATGHVGTVVVDGAEFHGVAASPQSFIGAANPQANAMIRTHRQATLDTSLAVSAQADPTMSLLANRLYRRADGR